MEIYLKSIFENINAVMSENIDIILKNKTHANTLKTICTSMHALEECLVSTAHNDEDLQILSRLGLRLHNSYQISIQLALSGYYQGCLMLIRDSVETMFTFQYLMYNQNLIKQWVNADFDQRQREFSQAKIRKFLHNLDGHEASVMTRHNHYSLLSELGTHATSKGFIMYQLNGNTIIGPFSDEEKLMPCLNHIAMHTTEGAASVMQMIKPITSDITLRKTFYEQTMDWYKQISLEFSEAEKEEFARNIHLS